MLNHDIEDVAIVNECLRYFSQPESGFGFSFVERRCRTGHGGSGSGRGYCLGRVICLSDSTVVRDLSIFEVALYVEDHAA